MLLLSRAVRREDAIRNAGIPGSAVAGGARAVAAKVGAIATGRVHVLCHGEVVYLPDSDNNGKVDCCMLCTSSRRSSRQKVKQGKKKP